MDESKVQQGMKKVEPRVPQLVRVQGGLLEEEED